MQIALPRSITPRSARGSSVHHVEQPSSPRSPIRDWIPRFLSIWVVASRASSIEASGLLGRRIEEGEVEPLTWALGELRPLVTAPAYAGRALDAPAGRPHRDVLQGHESAAHADRTSPPVPARHVQVAAADDRWPHLPRRRRSRRFTRGAKRDRPARVRCDRCYATPRGRPSGVSAPRHRASEDRRGASPHRFERAQPASTPRPGRDGKRREAPWPVAVVAARGAWRHVDRGPARRRRPRRPARDSGATGGDAAGRRAGAVGCIHEPTARHRVVERELRTAKPSLNRRPARVFFKFSVSARRHDQCASGQRERAARSARRGRHRRWSGELERAT